MKTADDFRTYLKEIGANIPFDEKLESSVFAEPWQMQSGRTIGNRFCILPMEGWDGTTDGRPSEHTQRRWHHFAISGAKLLWGCEAVAVRPEGRANPHQLMINEVTLPDFVALYKSLIKDHAAHFGNASDLLIGLQLTHSGRFCKPTDKKKMEPRILYPHPILNRKFGLGDDYPLMSDDDIDGLVADFIKAAKLAQKAGFHFVDIKHCHGYLGHEFLSAINRGGKYGGSFENRTLFLRSIVEGIRKEAPGLEMGVRLSAIDLVPFVQADDKVGEPADLGGKPYHFGFGGEPSGLNYDLHETKKFLRLLEELNIELVCITAGSPYYNPHVTRPALFPPSDGYLPPEDPLLGVARHLEVTAVLKKEFPKLAIVGSGYSYLQEWLPHVGQAVLRNGDADFVGLGRMVLSYPEMPADVLAGEGLKRQKICRTFSDCTTGPRNGLISGCFPLDPYYKEMEEAAKIKEIKKEL